MASFFSHLYPEPPTPPKDADHHLVQDALQQADDFLDTSSLDKFDSVEEPRSAPLKGPSSSALHTPPVSSPLPSIETNKQVEDRSRKRLRFHDEPSFCEDLPVTAPSSNSEAVAKLKSILKPRDPNVVDEAPRSDAEGQLRQPHEYDSVMEMLDSIVQQLASAKTENRREGYSVLVNALKAYSEFPEPEAILQKLPLFEEYLRRDISSASTAADPLENQMITQALRLTAIFLWNQTILPSLTHDFLQFLVDSSLECLAKKESSKETIIHHMYFLTCRQLYKTAMTPRKVTDLIQLLSNIHEFNLGKNALSIRIMVYHHLISLVPKIMLSTLDLWLPNLFHGMLSGPKDVRHKAIEAGVDAGFRLGTSKRAGQALVKLFNSEIADGSIYLDNVEKQLRKFTRKDEKGKCADGWCVPQVWSMVVLLLRGSQQLLQRWSHIPRWLKIIQDCFNSTDQDLVVEAFRAWDRFIYSIQFTTRTRGSILKALRQPIASNVQRKSPLKSKRVLEAALSTYTTLLYYAFPPGESAEHNDLYWDEFVNGVLNNMQHWNDVTGPFVCRVLSTLFGGLLSRPWDMDRMRADDGQTLQPEELARLDPQWIRKSLDKVLKPVESLLRFDWAWLSQTEEPPRAESLWKISLSAVREASAKEVTANIDVKSAVAAIVNVICKFERTYPDTFEAERKAADAHIERLTYLCVTALEEVGPLQFTDPFLQATEHNSFEVFSTPSKQQCAPLRPRSRPIAVLFRLFALQTWSEYAKTQALQSSSRILQKCLEAQTTRSSRLGLIKACVESIWATKEIGNKRAQSWGLLCNLASDVLKGTSYDTADHKAEKIGYEYRKAVRILCAGLSFADHDSLNDGETLFRLLRETVHNGVDETALIMSVIDPLLGAIEQDGHISPDISAAYVSWILDSGFVLPEEKARNRTRELLFDFWDLDATGPTKSSSASFQSLCSATEATIIRVCSGDIDEKISRAFLTALQKFLNPMTCPLPALFLLGIKNGLRLVAEDVSGKLLSDSHGISSLHSDTKKLWSSILALITSLKPADSNLLLKVETILIAGFCSKSKSIANMTIEAWNFTFGLQDNIRCSSHLITVLSQLKDITTLEMPPISPIDGAQDIASPSITRFAWMDDHPSPELQAQVSRKLQRMSSPLPWSRSPRQASPSPRRASTPLRTPSRPSPYRTPPARLRHNDSQIQFVPVDSSPLNEDDSQMLTEHQKDVRSQQRAEMALFAELGSSPSVTITKPKDPYLLKSPVQAKLPSPILLAPPQFQVDVEDHSNTDRLLGVSNAKETQPSGLDGSNDLADGDELPTSSSAVTPVETIDEEGRVVHESFDPAALEITSEATGLYTVNSDNHISFDYPQQAAGLEQDDAHMTRNNHDTETDKEDRKLLNTLLDEEEEEALFDASYSETLMNNDATFSATIAANSHMEDNAYRSAQAEGQFPFAESSALANIEGEHQSTGLETTTHEDVTSTIEPMAQVRDSLPGDTSSISFITPSAIVTGTERFPVQTADELEQFAQESTATQRGVATRHFNSQSPSPSKKRKTYTMAAEHHPMIEDPHVNITTSNESQESSQLSVSEDPADADDSECITLQRPTADTPTFREVIRQREQANRKKSRRSRLTATQSSDEASPSLRGGARIKRPPQKVDEAIAPRVYFPKDSWMWPGHASSQENSEDIEIPRTRQGSKRKSQGPEDTLEPATKRHKSDSQTNAHEELLGSHKSQVGVSEYDEDSTSGDQASNKSGPSSNEPPSTEPSGSKRHFTRKNYDMSKEKLHQYDSGAVKKGFKVDSIETSIQPNDLLPDSDANSQMVQNSGRALKALESIERKQSRRAKTDASQEPSSPHQSQLQPLTETEQNTRLRGGSVSAFENNNISEEDDIDGTTLMEVDDIDEIAKAPTSPTSPRKPAPRPSSSNVQSSPFSPDGSPSIVLLPNTSSGVMTAASPSLQMSQRARNVIAMIKDTFLPGLRDLALEGNDLKQERGELEDLGFAIMKEINAVNRRQGQ